MSNFRFETVNAAASRTALPEEKVSTKRAINIYGKNVFTAAKMQAYLPKTTFKELSKAIEEGSPISRELADVISQAMKTWAIENGASHYTHWFQPLTGSTAEKHDAFFEP